MQAVLDLPQTISTVDFAAFNRKSIFFALAERRRAVFFDVSWETYQNLLKMSFERRNPKLYYDRGILEIMPLPEHEFPIRLLDSLFSALADESEIDYVNFGSSTFDRDDFEKGFEPDSSYYLNENAEIMRGKNRFDLVNNPPPDLVFEVDITSTSIDKLSIYAQFGIKEVWIFESNELRFLHLVENKYIKQNTSLSLPNLTTGTATKFIEESRNLKRPEWNRKVKNWAKQHLSK